jgi:hypothetical protein
MSRPIKANGRAISGEVVTTKIRVNPISAEPKYCRIDFLDGLTENNFAMSSKGASCPVTVGVSVLPPVEIRTLLVEELPFWLIRGIGTLLVEELPFWLIRGIGTLLVEEILLSLIRGFGTLLVEELRFPLIPWRSVEDFINVS